MGARRAKSEAEAPGRERGAGARGLRAEGTPVHGSSLPRGCLGLACLLAFNIVCTGNPAPGPQNFWRTQGTHKARTSIHRFHQLCCALGEPTFSRWTRLIAVEG
eukprot:6365596-Alexandrium_andersonii.AAC.1